MSPSIAMHACMNLLLHVTYKQACCPLWLFLLLPHMAWYSRTLPATTPQLATAACCSNQLCRSFLPIPRYVNEKDLAFFKYHAVQDGPCEGASPWEQMMHKDVPGFVRYTSWRRTLPSGKTEYKSVTISPNATAREFSDLYLDDDFRCDAWGG